MDLKLNHVTGNGLFSIDVGPADCTGEVSILVKWLECIVEGVISTNGSVDLFKT